ncbi:MAG: glycoside hydrolase family 9 protein [Gammaproteobacteria bacterium]|nr:glycoside hydrolase family 9 protein [Gammaproteobacteria bacterium]
MISRRDVLESTAALALLTRARITSGATAPAPVPEPRAGGSAVAPASRYAWPVHAPLQADLQHALFVRNLSKPVEDRRVIDDMETDRGWTASPAVTLDYTAERARAGRRSLRLRVEQRSEAFIRASRRPNGSFTGSAALFDMGPHAATARLRFDSPQDWTAFNRISVWCYVHPAGNPVTSLALQFLCDGAPAGPVDPIAVHYFADLREGEWNLLAWEFPEMARDRVTEVMFFQPISGLPFRTAASTLTYDLDLLQLERVAPCQVDGWDLAPGKIAYSHVGYATHGSKLAIAQGAASEFSLIDAASGQERARLAAQQVETRRGRFRVVDFSSFRTPGRYLLRSPDATSEAFTIADGVWRPLVEATLNAFYGLRCGFAVPGVHDACHCDLLVKHGDELRVGAGGWHDAANLSQDPINTHISICALLDLAASLEQHDPALSARALEEARWGIEWVERMRFAPGVRWLMGSYAYFTDSERGTVDDIVADNVGSNTFKNLTAALAEARGARALRASEPARAAGLLRAAEEDFATVLKDRPSPPIEQGEPDWHEVPWQNEVGYIVLTAVELHRGSGKPHYAEVATQYARWLLDTQEARFIDGSPVTGYWYEDARRTRILHEFQRTSGAPNSFEEGGPLALQALCDAFPDHPDWIRWYYGLAAYSEYFCRKGAEAAAPFDVVPAAVWRRRDLDAPRGVDRMGDLLSRVANPIFPSRPTPDLIRRQMEELYTAGTWLAPDQRLRTFPLYVDHVRHGATAVHLTKTIGLAAAATFRGRPELAELAARQVQWTVGANPFSRSLVYGVGYDWWQNFTVSLPNFVGGLAVGMNTYRGDAPAWGNNAVFPYKEVWVVSSARLATVLARMPGVARVRGQAPTGATFRHLASGAVTRMRPGRFDQTLAPGEYAVTFAGFTRRLVLVDGAVRQLDLDLRGALEIRLQARAEGIAGIESGAPGLRLRVDMRGRGRHSVALRAANLRLVPTSLDADLGRNGQRTFDVDATLIDAQQPWVVVAVPNGRPADRVEALGTSSPQPDLSRVIAVGRDAS